VEALNAYSLKHFQLLIILRDGMNWPNGYDKEPVKWMTDAQQQAIWDFVNDGGGFLALHNAQGIYPPGGLYYKLFGGDYGGHPEPYKFTVRVENKYHPITAGVEDFTIFDEQHTVKYYPTASIFCCAPSRPTTWKARPAGGARWARGASVTWRPATPRKPLGSP